MAALMAAPAWAAGSTADDDDSPVTWSVAPADEDGPDKRHWFELSLEAGATATEHLAVTNLSRQQVTFSLDAADGYFTPKGRFSMLNDPSESVAAGTWIDVAPTVTVESGETAIVPFTVTVPANAEPGDHAAGIAASVVTGGSDSDGSNLAVRSRFGVRVMTRVLGELAPALSISRLEAGYSTSWNPIRPGRLRVEFELVNTGNTRLRVTGAVAAGGGQAGYPAEAEPVIELLPGASHTVSTSLTEVWPWFRVKATVLAEPTAVAVDGDSLPPLDPVSVSTAAWAVPWPQLACLAAVALMLVAIFGGRSRSRRKIAALVEQARAEGRAQARADAPPDSQAGAQAAGLPDPPAGAPAGGLPDGPAGGPANGPGNGPGNAPADGPAGGPARGRAHGPAGRDPGRAASAAGPRWRGSAAPALAVAAAAAILVQGSLAPAGAADDDVTVAVSISPVSATATEPTPSASVRTPEPSGTAPTSQPTLPTLPTPPTASGGGPTASGRDPGDELSGTGAGVGAALLVALAITGLGAVIRRRWSASG
jgi:hypothetical protein